MNQVYKKSAKMPGMKAIALLFLLFHSFETFSAPLEENMEKKVVKSPTFNGLPFCETGAGGSASYVCSIHGYNSAFLPSQDSYHSEQSRYYRSSWGPCYMAVQGEGETFNLVKMQGYSGGIPIDEIHCFRAKKQ
jgi:hypothetical protein